MGLLNRYWLINILTCVCLFSPLTQADFKPLDLLGFPRETLNTDALPPNNVSFNINLYQSQLRREPRVTVSRIRAANPRLNDEYSGPISALVLPLSSHGKWSTGGLQIPKDIQVLEPREKATDYVEFFSPGAYHIFGSDRHYQVTGIPEGRIRSFHRWPMIAHGNNTFYVVSVETDQGRRTLLYTPATTIRKEATFSLGDVYIEPHQAARQVNGILIFEKSEQGIALDRLFEGPEKMMATADELQRARNFYEVHLEHMGFRVVISIDSSGSGEVLKVGQIGDDPLSITKQTRQYYGGEFLELHLPSKKLQEFGVPPDLVGPSESSMDEKPILSFVTGKQTYFVMNHDGLTNHFRQDPGETPGGAAANQWRPQMSQEEAEDPFRQQQAASSEPYHQKVSSAKAWAEVGPFALDAKKMVRANLPRPTSGEQELIDSLFRSLSRFEIASPKILGQPGTGKSYLIELFVAAIVAGECPGHLKDYKVLALNLASLQGGSGYTQVIEKKIAAMIELSQKENIIWLVDEAHILRTIGTHRDNPDGVMQLLKPYLQSGVIKLIPMSTPPEWEHAFGSDPAWNRRFTPVNVPEAKGEAVISALKGFAQKHRLPEMEPSVLKLIARLSDDFNPMEYQPGKAISLLDEVMADIRLRGGLRAATADDVKRTAQRFYNLHPDNFDRLKMAERLSALPDFLTERVVGQNEPAQALADAFEMSFGGAMDKMKPKGLILFPGDKGQGKTEMIQAAGEGMGKTVKRIVMSGYTNPAHTDKVKQAIYEAWVKDPNGILFFDEIEKANPLVQRDLLELLDSGKFSVELQNSGRTFVKEVILRNVHVFMATNAGSDYLRSLRDRSEYDKEQMKQAMIKDDLHYLVLDRMTGGIVPFFYLSREDYKKVVLRHVKKTIKNYLENNPEVKLHLENLRGFIDQTIRDTYQEKMSNRAAVEAMQKLSLAIVKVVNRSTDLSDVRVSLKGERDPKLQRWSAPVVGPVIRACWSAHSTRQ